MSFNVFVILHFVRVPGTPNTYVSRYGTVLVPVLSISRIVQISLSEYSTANGDFFHDHDRIYITTYLCRYGSKNGTGLVCLSLQNYLVGYTTVATGDFL